MLFLFSGLSQSGKVMDQLTLDSKILKGERKFAVYLPPDYESSNRSYPVLYLLHGYTDDQTGWIQFGEVHHITDTAIKEGKATPMIIIMPDADTGIPGYANSINGKWDYEDFFFEELMPHVEKRFRIKRNKRFRAVAGLSMGGGGSFLYAFHRPDLFSSAAPLSAWMGPQTIEEMRDFAKRENIKFNENNFESFISKNNPLKRVLKSTKSHRKGSKMPKMSKRFSGCPKNDRKCKAGELRYAAIVPSYSCKEKATSDSYFTLVVTFSGICRNGLFTRSLMSQTQNINRAKYIFIG